jgi:DNA-binding transcriptional ArsR family regulator
MPQCGAATMFNQTVDRSAPPRQSWPMCDRADPLDLVFSALADPTRRAILALLLEDDMAVTDVAEPFAMSLSAVSKHLGVLSAAGLISQERRGRVKWCKLEPEALREASVWMQAFGQFDRLDLDAFERFLETELRDRPEEDEPGTDDVPAETAER